MLVPATKLTLELVPFRLKFVAAGTVGPFTVIVEALELSVMFAPATRLTLELLPFRLKFVAAGTVGPTTVIEDAPVFRLILAPATSTIEPVLKAPAVPIADTTLALFEAEMVIVDALLLNAMLFPATKETLDELPFRLKAVPPGGAPIMVREDAPLFIVIFAPATNESDPVEPLRAETTDAVLPEKNGNPFHELIPSPILIWLLSSWTPTSP